jgi:GntR family transcriptional regulator/MocR family aminotransferase
MHGTLLIPAPRSVQLTDLITAPRGARPPIQAEWISLQRFDGETLRAALARTLREAILSGALRSGVRLPASRALATQLRVSRGVVSDAYQLLEIQGFLVSRSRAAPVVARLPSRSAAYAVPEVDPGPPRYDLTPTAPDVRLFPLRRWTLATQQVARRAGVAALDYRDSRGEYALRAALADHLGRTRGVVADPAQILIVQGTAQSVDLLLRILRARGKTRIAVEDPSHRTQHERIKAMGLELVAQSVDDQGLVVEGLAADAVLVTPAHQFPTGCVLSDERRTQLIAWAQLNDGLIIEDDYDSEFRFDRKPVQALQGVAPDHVVQLGTISKTLAPALRLGWMVVPADFIDEAVSMKRLLDDFSPALDQLTLAELIKRGDYDLQVRRARNVYRLRRDRTLASLNTNVPGLAPEGIAAGVHLLLRFPAGVDDAAVALAAREAGIRVPALSYFHIRPATTGGLVIGYGRVHESAIDDAIGALAQVLGQHMRTRHRRVSVDAQDRTRRPTVPTTR